MTYAQTLHYLYQQLPMFHRIGAAAYKANLDNTKAIDRLLGHPHRAFASVHIAGTNGKGSVAHMLASVFQHAGYTTGLYTSPHLKDFRERIRVNGRMIPKAYVTAFVKRHRVAFEKIKPSFFEWTVGLAFDYFREKKPDVVIVETGLGGRLDSTNIITPLLSVITNISLDHMNLLGGTLQRIAREKAGIIKRGVPVVVGETGSGVKEIFEAWARAKKAPLVFADKVFRAEILTSRAAGNLQTIEIAKRGRHEKKKRFRLDLTGSYQVRSVCTVLAALDRLGAHFALPRRAVEAGLRSVMSTTGFRGRWQVIGRQPLVICDAGHNEAGWKWVAGQLKSMHFKQLHIVLGVVNDKDLAGMLRALPRSARYYFCRADIPRGLDAVELAMRASAAGLHGDVYPAVRMAYQAARKMADKNDVIFVGGSVFTIAEIL